MSFKTLRTASQYHRGNSCPGSWSSLKSLFASKTHLLLKRIVRQTTNGMKLALRHIKKSKRKRRRNKRLPQRPQLKPLPQKPTVLRRGEKLSTRVLTLKISVCKTPKKKESLKMFRLSSLSFVKTKMAPFQLSTDSSLLGSLKPRPTALS